VVVCFGTPAEDSATDRCPFLLASAFKIPVLISVGCVCLAVGPVSNSALVSVDLCIFMFVTITNRCTIPAVPQVQGESDFNPNSDYFLCSWNFSPLYKKFRNVRSYADW